MKAMILAAGLGSRLKDLTKNTPKALIKIKNKTLLEILISKLKSQGINEIIINVHHHAQQIIDFINSNNKFDISIECSQESELLDTGGGLKKASWFFDGKEPFLLYNVDVISDINISQMLDFHKISNSDVSIAIRSRKTSRYFLFDANNKLCGWKNEATNEEKIVRESSQKLLPFSFMGIHIISPEVFKYFPKEEKFSIVDFYLSIAAENKILGFPADKYSWIDCGKPENLIEAGNIIYHEGH
jgi:N-acetyl-alpha-D-muramate 1-phosphate uridylyltransferase